MEAIAEKPTATAANDYGSLAGQMTEWIQFAESHDKSIFLRDRALRGQDFYRGHQWSEEEWNVYQSKGITPITVNRSLRTIETLNSLLADNQPDFKVMPRRGGIEVVANLKTHLLKHCGDVSHLDQVISEVYQIGNILDEGYIIVKFNEYDGPNGQAYFEAKTPFAVYPDPLCKQYDLNAKTGAARFVVEREWVDKDEFLVRYEGKARETGEGVAINNDPNGVIDYLLGGSDISGYADDDENSTIGVKKYKILVRHVYWREPVKGLLVRDRQNGMQRIFTDQAKINAVRKQVKDSGTKRFTLKDIPANKLHHTVVCAGQVLGDELNPFGDELVGLPCFRYAPHFDDGYSFGALDNQIPLNIEENKNRTNTLRYMTAVCNSGFIGKTPKNAKARKEIEEFGAVNGKYWNKDDYGGELERMEPNPYPAGFDRLAMQAAMDQKEVTGVNDPAMGNPTSANESGRAAIARIEQSRKTNQPQLARLFWTLLLAGEYTLKLITDMDIYTDEEIRAIIGESGILTDGVLRDAYQEFKQKIGIDNPNLLQMPPNPQELMNPMALQMASPEDQPMVFERMKMGIEGATIYAQKFPQMLKNLDKVIREYAMRKILGQLRERTIAEYGVKVIISRNSPTVRMANLAELRAINESYPGVVPPEQFIDATDLSDKEGLKMKIQQNRAAMQRQPMPIAAGAA